MEDIDDPLPQDLKKVYVYPAYFNKKNKTRKVPLELAIDNPNPLAVLKAIESAGFPCVAENKRHPKDYLTMGRIAVEIIADGRPILSQITKSSRY